MKAIVTVTHDGIRNLVSVERSDFDTQAWADRRKPAFELIGITKVVERPLELSRSAGSNPIKDL